MLDTEWMMRTYFKPAPKSLWDEMFARHDRERLALLQWEDSRTLKRTMSCETVRRLGKGKAPDFPSLPVKIERSASPGAAGGPSAAGATTLSDEEDFMDMGEESDPEDEAFTRWRSPSPTSESGNSISSSASNDALSASDASDWEKCSSTDKSSDFENLAESDLE
jgi:hypothetical protein